MGERRRSRAEFEAEAKPTHPFKRTRTNPAAAVATRSISPLPTVSSCSPEQAWDTLHTYAYWADNRLSTTKLRQYLEIAIQQWPFHSDTPTLLHALFTKLRRTQHTLQQKLVANFAWNILLDYSDPTQSLRAPTEENQKKLLSIIRAQWPDHSQTPSLLEALRKIRFKEEEEEEEEEDDDEEEELTDVGMAYTRVTHLPDRASNAQVDEVKNDLIKYATKRDEAFGLSPRLASTIPSAVAIPRLSHPICRGAHFRYYRGCPAGLIKEDQSERLLKIKKAASSLAGISKVHLVEPWHSLCERITNPDYSLTSCLRYHEAIPSTNPIKILLEKTHCRSYLLFLIIASRDAYHSTTTVELDGGDIQINPYAFQCMIEAAQLALSPQRYRAHKHRIYITPPGHHAAYRKPAGFCWANLAVMLIHNAQRFSHVVVIGLDINADNGIKASLSGPRHPRAFTTYHLDCYDRNVYPKQVSPNQTSGTYEYVGHQIIDQPVRHAPSIHQSMAFIIGSLFNAARKAKRAGAPLRIIVPLGWDSHVKEVALCGLSTRDGRDRFNDTDFKAFYHAVYWLNYKSGLDCQVKYCIEGGYTESVYKRQMQLLTIIAKQGIDAVPSIAAPGSKRGVSCANPEKQYIKLFVDGLSDRYELRSAALYPITSLFDTTCRQDTPASIPAIDPSRISAAYRSI